MRWEPASGDVEHFFDDEPVPGTHGVSHTLLRQVEPFPTHGARALRHGVSLGLRRRALPDRALRRRAERRRTRCDKLRAMCAAQIPGDTYRNLQIHPTYSAQTFKHILVPVWLLTYNFGAKAYQVVVNGVHRADGRRVSEEPVEDRAARARCDHRLPGDLMLSQD